MYVKITNPERAVTFNSSSPSETTLARSRSARSPPLGRLDQLGGELDSVINGLLKVAGREPWALRRRRRR